MIAPGNKRALVTIGYFEGDKKACFSLLSLLADLQLVKASKVDLLIVGRQDVTGSIPQDLRNKLEEKFHLVVEARCTPLVTGHPAGPNAMFNFVAKWITQLGRDETYKYFINLESDVVPLHRDWLDRAEALWVKAQAQGKKFVGLWQTNHPTHHMNGVGMYPPSTYSDLKLALDPCPPDLAYDIYSGPKMVNKVLSEGFAMEYRRGSITPEELYQKYGDKVFFHGVVDNTAIESVRFKQLGEPLPKKEVGTGKVFVQLGRNGDIVNLLPIVYEEFKASGKPVTMVVQEEFIGMLDGLTYVEPRMFKGDYGLITAATNAAKQKFKGRPVIQTQVWGRDYNHVNKTENFQKDSWNLAGQLHRWEQNTLIFDKRDRDREEKLRKEVRLSKDKPNVLLTIGGGFSSPFPYAASITSLIHRELGDAFNIVDLNLYKLDRLYDVLGVLDRCDLLVTADTCFLHLAGATSVPTIAFVSKEPWLRSCHRPNMLARIPYDKVKLDDVTAVLQKFRKGTYDVGHIKRVYCDYNPPEDDVRRISVANASWDFEMEKDGDSSTLVVKDTSIRNSSDLGDTKPTPYNKEMIEAAFATGADTVLFTNSDVGVAAGSMIHLRNILSHKGACFAYRFEFEKIEKPLDYLQTVSGKWSGGLDAFAFTRAWWDVNKDKLPSMVIGRTHWDLVWRDAIKELNGGEWYGAIWHENHRSFWTIEKDNVGNLHNLAVAAEWRKTHNTNEPFKALQ